MEYLREVARSAKDPRYLSDESGDFRGSRLGRRLVERGSLRLILLALILMLR